MFGYFGFINIMRLISFYEIDSNWSHQNTDIMTAILCRSSGSGSSSFFALSYNEIQPSSSQIGMCKFVTWIDNCFPFKIKSSVYKTLLSCVCNIMVADDLVTQGTMASATLLLT